ncbi:hypothetical protein FPV67DRAFT_1676758 [Lyophyllum atratum]|nr:hypothetical protein FPV67DRAFT_1676758 [Lyophyllum atratum]
MSSHHTAAWIIQDRIARQQDMHDTLMRHRDDDRQVIDANGEVQRFPTLLDKTYGGYTHRGNTTYYSPNSNRAVDVPISDDKRYHYKLFFRRDNALNGEYKNPEWWTQEYGWVAFTPLSPPLIGALLERLHHIPPRLPVGDGGGYRLPLDVAEKWEHLESVLLQAITAIRKVHTMPAILPFFPRALGYHAEFKCHEQAKLHIYRAREWILTWTGLLSYVIAMSNKNRRLPRWQSILAHEGFDLPLLDAIATSCICDFSPYTRRVGTFVDVSNYEVILWLHQLGVPVWYQWKDHHARDPLLKVFAPPPYTSSIAIHHTETLPPSSTPARDPYTPYKTLTKAERLAFVNSHFEMREKANELKLQRESADARQKRLNRMRQPPTVSASVFVWEEDSEDSTKFVRCQVPKQEREETLGWFSRSQKRYDAFWNEWDCCAEMGENDDDEEYDDDDPFDPSESLLSEMPAEHPRCLSPSRIPRKDSDGETLERFDDVKYSGNNFALMCDGWQQDFLETLRMYYGYLPPLPYPTYMAPMANESDAKLVFKFFGESLTHTLSFYRHRPIAQLAQQYMQQLIKRGLPPPTTCDVNDESRAALASSHRLRLFRKVFSGPRDDEVWYMFDLGQTATTKWHLAVQNARDALVICRLPDDSTEIEIAQYLLRYGIYFHTLQSAKTILRAKKRPFPPCVLPTRPKDYTFGNKDYDAYVLQRDAIFSQPSSRAALMRGGFVWRLTVPNVSFGAVLDGPSGWNEAPDTMFTAKDIKTGELFVDDQLTGIELDLICGAYVCDMASGSQPAIKSWYPLVSTFDKCGENYGRWTVYREEGFRRRTKEINCIDPSVAEASRGPLNFKKWRDLMRGMKDVRYLNENLDRWCTEFLDRHISSGTK